MAQHLRIATLSEEGAAKLKELESEMDVQIMAFESGSQLAELTKQQLNRIKSLEDELGMTLLVYKE